MLAVAILAAGKGTRMKSALPKVLQPLAGKTLLERVLTSCEGLNPDHSFIIVGHQAIKVENALLQKSSLQFVLQEPQLGTGHAIQYLIPKLKGFEGELLVLNGDVPLLQAKTIQKLLTKHRSYNSGVTLLSSRLSNPKGYGRVFSDKDNRVKSIIEDKDCNHAESINNLTNAGIYCFNWKELEKILPTLSNQNSQKEIYLTDAISKFSKAMHVEVENNEEVTGVNDRSQLAQCEAILQNRLKNEWMSKGVTFIDSNSCTISEFCTFGTDVIIEPQTHLRGSCVIGDNCNLGPGTLIRDSILGESVSVIYSVLNEVEVAKNVTIGPFSHLRPKAKVKEGSKIGNFVEVKNSVIGRDSKVNHLSYIGDCDLGEKVNIGAGTITANYDGRQKHKTIIGHRSKTGANSVLVAPINIGVDVTVGAGSVLTKDIPDGSLAIGRAKQFIKREWRQ